MKATLLLAGAALIAGTAFAQTGSPGNSAGGGTGTGAASDFNVPRVGVQRATGNDKQPSSDNASANRDSMGARSSAVDPNNSAAGQNTNSMGAGAGASTTPSSSSSNTLSTDTGSTSSSTRSGDTGASPSTMGNSSDSTSSTRASRADRN